MTFIFRFTIHPSPKTIAKSGNCCSSNESGSYKPSFRVLWLRGAVVVSKDKIMNIKAL